MNEIALKSKIEDLWNGNSEDLSCIQEAMSKLDSGKLRIANKIDGKWQVNDYLKKAILLFFKHTKSEVISGSYCEYFDKVPMKTKNWSEEDFASAGFRLVPGSVVRYSAHIAKSVVVMTSFINVGAFVDEGTLIDTNALVGSCAQIGKKCHVSDAVTIGGVLEPLQATPVIVEDNCFIGVKSSLTEGVIVQEGAVLAAGASITSSTKIINRETGEVSYGNVPPYSVVVPGSYESNGLNICCAVIVKQVTEQTRAKISINELLRV
ncbi:2,3,4,5-tetrahydropyridine-2,6-dicarboxylate N-succinyltransferase [Alphaproteobacteria bacterium]|nr:2,3,4,5-tetrahydropyridine-2,6-dicarboxylate N-succinyltransferase [Alphaproteobacteria bacterium]